MFFNGFLSFAPPLNLSLLSQNQQPLMEQYLRVSGMFKEYIYDMQRLYSYFFHNYGHICSHFCSISPRVHFVTFNFDYCSSFLVCLLSSPSSTHPELFCSFFSFPGHEFPYLSRVTGSPLAFEQVYHSFSKFIITYITYIILTSPYIANYCTSLLFRSLKSPPLKATFPLLSFLLIRVNIGLSQFIPRLSSQLCSCN